MRIAIGGFQHETNTFAPGTTPRAAFDAPGGWPPFCRGAAMLGTLAEGSAPASGALAVARAEGAVPVPLLWCIALPSAPVANAAFEEIAGEILDRLVAAHAEAPLDGIYLDLHGAMAAESFPDAEGELLRRVRARFPEPFPVMISLDLHANVSAGMIAAATQTECYRTYPHVDMRDTGARAMTRLIGLIRSGTRPARAFRPVPFLTALTGQCTLTDPTRALVARGVAMEGVAGVTSVAQCFGFPLADIADAGPSIAVHADTQARADAAADALLADWIAAEPGFARPVPPARPAVAEAMARAAGPGRGPVVIADTQDNPGGGGSGDTTGMLAALLAEGAAGAVLVHLADPAACEAAHAAGTGALLDIAIGGALSPGYGAPIPGPWRVAALGDGTFTGVGPMYRGNRIALGPVALLERDGVQAIVAPRKMQASEPALLHHLGLDPETLPILVVKSSVHFRGAYQDMARAVIVAAAPGVVTADLTELPYRHATRRVAGAG